MAPLYAAHGITLFHGDLILVLKEQWEEIWPIQTVLTVPPWVQYAKAASLVDGRVPWTIADEAEWQASCVWHYHQWCPLMKQLIADSNGRAWLIVHMAYALSLCRVAHLLKWETPAIWTTPGSALVVVQFGERIDRAGKARVQEALDGATNPMEDLMLHQTILSLSGGPVIDPFCGTGLTLQAARLLNLRAVGIEIREPQCQAAVARLEGRAA